MNLEVIRHVYLRRVVGTLLGALGIEAATGLARWLARGVSDLNTAGRRRAEARLRDAPGSAASDAEISATVAAMYDNVARFWIEALFARRLLRDASWRRFVRLEQEASLRALAEANRGCLLATA